MATMALRAALSLSRSGAIAHARKNQHRDPDGAPFHSSSCRRGPDHGSARHLPAGKGETRLRDSRECIVQRTRIRR
jgi:hypothetical protein